ncbi:MAG TPA: aspartate 1-decarboxylase [Tepidisphaeraceae bacterium]|nr:aspartate 1-decarboxylase [Tepidisphaeraceae bacterium]
MLTNLLKAKIHNATVTVTDVNYHGSITIDTELLQASGMLVNEHVLVADCENGNRFETYIIPGEAGGGMIGVNGAAARLTAPGHRVIVMSFVLAQPNELAGHKARVLIVDGANKVREIIEH